MIAGCKAVRRPDRHRSGNAAGEKSIAGKMTLELSPIKEISVPDMLAGRTLTRNTIWNLLGQAAPMVALIAVPDSVMVSASNDSGYSR